MPIDIYVDEHNYRKLGMKIATFATVAIPMPGSTAERITGYFPPFKDVSV
jgi:hypothetical protein